jgi:DNA-binding NarL/FixJ family response regulator
MSGGIVADFLLSEKATPYDHTVVNDFIEALTAEEQNVLDDLNAGFKRKEICQRQSITNIRLNSLHKSIQDKAVSYL